MKGLLIKDFKIIMNQKKMLIMMVPYFLFQKLYVLPVYFLLQENYIKY